MRKTAKSGNWRSSKKPLGKEESKKEVLGQRGHLHLFCAYAKGDTLVRLNSGQARRHKACVQVSPFGLFTSLWRSKFLSGSLHT